MKTSRINSVRSMIAMFLPCVFMLMAADCERMKTIIENSVNPKNPDMIGFADIHTHHMAHLAYAGNFLHGLPWGRIDAVLPHCNSMHGAGGVNDFVGNMLRPSYCGNVLGHNIGGYPEFDGWPRWNNVTHQAMYEDWLYRAYQGGLRLMVMLAVNNEALVANNGIVSATGRTNLDDEAVRLQIQAAKDFQAYLDLNNNNNGWYRIVTTAQEAQAVIQNDKLAVVLGVEVDYPLNSYRDGLEVRKDYYAQIQNYYNMGIRHFFPIHFDNNAIGGTAFDNALKYEAPTLVTIPLKDYYGIGVDPDSRYKKGKVNKEGLTNLGKCVIKDLMSFGVVIDVDHASAKSRDEIFSIAEKYNYAGIVSGHTGFIDLAAKDEKSHEGNLRADEISRIKNLGGLIAPILWQGENKTWNEGSTRVPATCHGTSEDFAQAILYLNTKLGADYPVAIGSDFNVTPTGGPRFGEEGCPCNDFPRVLNPTTYPRTLYPFTLDWVNKTLNESESVQQKWNINDDGIAHVGMLPDLLADLRTIGLSVNDVKPIYNSAKKYVELWAAAERSAPNIKGQPPEVNGGTIFTNDKLADVIEFTIEKNATASDKVLVEICLGANSSGWRKSLNMQTTGFNVDLSVENTQPCASTQLDVNNLSVQLNFWKAKGIGFMTPVRQGIPILNLGKIEGGDKIKFIWKKDT